MVKKGDLVRVHADEVIYVYVYEEEGEVFRSLTIDKAMGVVAGVQTIIARIAGKPTVVDVFAVELPGISKPVTFLGCELVVLQSAPTFLEQLDALADMGRVGSFNDQE